MPRMPSNWKLKRQFVGERDGFVCRHCGAIENLTLDHVIPKAYNGSNSVWNLQLLCAKCNNEKADTLPDGVTAVRRRKPVDDPPHPWMSNEPVMVLPEGAAKRFGMRVPLSTFFPRGDRELEWTPAATSGHQ